jgi:hypothetical protein
MFLDTSWRIPRHKSQRQNLCHRIVSRFPYVPSDFWPHVFFDYSESENHFQDQFLWQGSFTAMHRLDDEQIHAEHQQHNA